jgi:hypothetical protein
MLKPRRALAAGFVLIVTIGLSVQSLSASELSDAESRLDQLRQSLESDTQLLNVTLRGYELDAFNCVQQYRGETSSVLVALRNDCQTALDRTQADIFSVTRRAAATQNEMTSLRALIEKLKSTPTPTPTPSPTNISTPENTVVGTESNQSVSTVTTMPSSDSGKTKSPSPVENTPAASQSAKPASSKSPAPSPSSNVKSKKPVQKKTTITCVKGNVVKKVTDVSPKCPVGFKKK